MCADPSSLRCYTYTAQQICQTVSHGGGFHFKNIVSRQEKMERGESTRGTKTRDQMRTCTDAELEEGKCGGGKYQRLCVELLVRVVGSGRRGRGERGVVRVKAPERTIKKQCQLCLLLCRRAGTVGSSSTVAPLSRIKERAVFILVTAIFRSNMFEVKQRSIQRSSKLAPPPKRKERIHKRISTLKRTKTNPCSSTRIDTQNPIWTEIASQVSLSYCHCCMCSQCSPTSRKKEGEH